MTIKVRLLTSKRWLDFPLVEDVGVGSFIRRLRKRRNMDVLLGKSGVVMDIPDDDLSKLSEEISKEAT